MGITILKTTNLFTYINKIFMKGSTKNVFCDQMEIKPTRLPHLFGISKGWLQA